MSRSDEEKDTVSRADDFLQMFKKGAEFTQDLLKENERLRFRIVKLEESLKERGQGESSDSANVLEMMKKIETLEQEKEELIDKLNRAAQEVKKLSGFLPICANCKKIRDDKGYWKQVESYISEHSDAVFNHSICPQCSASHFARYDSPPDATS